MYNARKNDERATTNIEEHFVSGLPLVETPKALKLVDFDCEKHSVLLN